jgi:hypothetical protein
MSRFALVPVALVVAVLGLLAAGCGSSGRQTSATPATSASKGSAPCRLGPVQHRAIARVLADIRRLRRIEASMHTFSERGAPGQEALTGKVLLDLGTGNLPLNVFSRLLHLAKAAVRLCGDCSTGLETEEPFLGTRAHNRCS